MQYPLVRLYFWQGEALYIGAGLDSSWHHHHAVQIGVSLGAPFAIRQDPNQIPTPCRGFVAPSHVFHQVYSAGVPSVFIWVESESAVAAALMSTYSSQTVTLLSDDLSLEIVSDVSRQVNCSTARTIVDHIYAQMCDQPIIANPIDARIQAVVDRINHTSEVDISLLTHELAISIYLSPSRLRHLFREQIGISIQQYILWQKLMIALSASVGGVSLTDAAHEAGFSDLAHLSRTFRQMFGIKPSEIFGDSHRVQVNACQF